MGVSLRMGVAAALGLAATCGAAETPRCKYLAFGWEPGVMTPAKLLEHAADFDRTALDGMGLRLSFRRADGTLLNYRRIFTDPVWTRADVEPLVAPLRELTKHRAFRETLLPGFRSPMKRVPWTDDALWARVTETWRTIAWLAKTTGCRGFWVDPEDYQYQEQFRRAGDEPPYAELAAVARRRGHEVFGAMFAEFPDPVVLGFWLFSFQGKAAATPDGARLLAEAGDLWCPFLNGMLDVAPPGARFVDGNEDSYHFDPLQHHFARNAQRQRERLLSVVAPENRDKYRAQMLPGAALYMDMYTSTNPAGKYYRGPLDGSRVRRFEQDLAAATAASGGYVWLWGEQHMWGRWTSADLDPDVISRERWFSLDTARWEELVPGLNLAMKAVKDPHGLCHAYGDKLLARFGEANVVADPACAPAASAKDPDAVPKGFGSWQDKRFRIGTFSLDRTIGEGDSSSLCATGVGNGCFSVPFGKVRGGDYYEVGVSVLGEACIFIQWKRTGANGKLAFDRELNFTHVPIEGADATRWRRARTFVRIPDEATGADLMLDVHQTEGQKTHFDNVTIRRVLDFSRDMGEEIGE